jgi:hypothetical protein
MQLDDHKRELARQVEHWRMASLRLGQLDLIAPAQAWQALEHYLGVSLRQALDASVQRLRFIAESLAGKLRLAVDEQALLSARKELLELRRLYSRTEASVEFYADALATRAIPQVAVFLRACDHLATRSMAEILTPLGRQVPSALTYLGEGMGASILRAGIRLWDGTTDNPVSTIKVVRHALFYRPTSILHEAGHQVAHMLGWNQQYAAMLARELSQTDARAAGVWASWASEITADAFAFVHTGYAAVVALHDVLDGTDETVFQLLHGDPHPVGYLRVLLNIEMARRSYGDGPWDRMQGAWIANHPLSKAPDDVRSLLEVSTALLPKVVELTLYTPYPAFGNRPLATLINPARVSPQALDRLEQEIGSAAYTSPYWGWNEAIRVLALNGYRGSIGPKEHAKSAIQQEKWMQMLGTMKRAA